MLLKDRGRTKKGDVTDMVIFLITIFILAIGLFVMAFVVPSITQGLKATALNESAEGSDAIQELENFGTVGIQRGFFLVFIGLIISTLITSFLVRVHPIFLFLYIIFLGIAVFLGTYLGNAYEELISNPALASILVEQTLINIVMSNIIWILIGVGALSMIIVFSKFSSLGRSGIGGQL